MLFPTYSNVDRGESRRSFLIRSSSLALAAFAAGCATGPISRNVSFPAYPFQLGVASGDPDDSSVVLWTRLAPKPLEFGGMPPEAVEVEWIVADDEQLTRIVKRGKEIARPEWGHSVHAEVNGLRPDRWYFYQFKAGAEVSPVGRTRTLPQRNSLPASMRFAFASCQHFEAGLFTAYDHMQRESLDLVIHLGDYIYEGPGRDKFIRKHHGKEIFSLDDYRHRHAQYRTDAALQGMHATAPWFLTWDDHEVDNNYASHISEDPKVGEQQLLARRAAAFQAYYEHMPLRRSALPKGPNMRLYRRAHLGRLADLHILDTRQYRTDQPCGDGNKPNCPETFNPDATLMGLEQREWLFGGLARSRAQWNILGQQVMMGHVDRAAGAEQKYSMDQWPGYEMERRKVLEFFRNRKIKNPIVLTGDIHTNWANELSAEFDRLDGKPVATEFVGTSISSGGDPANPAKTEQLYAENPFVKFHNNERGYVVCTVRPDSWKTEYRTLDTVTKPGGKLKTPAAFVVENGRPELQKV